MKTMNYRTAAIIATSLHIFLACFFMLEPHSNQFVTQSTPRSNDLASMEIDHSEPQPIQAVSVDSRAVDETLNRLKAERAQKQQAELNHQRAVEQQLRMAQQQRMQEQKRIEQMKKEAAQL
ncbi:MAG TPA: cell envelope integrity protein TolA, partial [Legionellaceae bacterium]|nr:cell envelope integrity protein TolA [Legionellaceae bacterium]